ncbi:MAG: uracil-DNA glycosylase [Thiotrichales bacterium]|nr:uracil-DNA glycosylase [Thiotrichales bacterium]
MKKTNSIDCFKCRHFYITWDANQSRGCKAFGFKTKQMPSIVVFETSGAECLKYSPKPEQDQSKNPSKKKGWIA